MEQNKEYYAFISYKREDKAEAKRLQKALEYYRLPNNLRQEHPELPEYVRPVFRDMTDLEVGELSAQIHSALEQSHYLIVVCSPRAAASKWVNDEIEYFISLGKQDKIIPYIIEGIPHSSNPAEECYPPALLRLSKEKELLGANINEVGKDSATLRVVSRMFNIRFDTLYQRYQREQKKHRIQMVCAIVIAFLFLSSIMGWILHQNTLLKDRENKMVINQARAIVKNALTYIDDGDLEMAVALLLNINDKTRSLFDEECMPEIEYAFRVAYDSLLYSTATPKRKIRNFGGSMLSASISSDDSVIVTGSTDGTVRFWDIKSGNEIEEKRIIRPTSVWAKFSPYSNHLLTIDYEDTIGIWRQEKERYILDRYITDSFLVPSTTFIDDKSFFIKNSGQITLCYKDSTLNETKWKVKTFDEGDFIISKEKIVFNDYHRGKFIIYDMINNKNYNCKLRSSYNGWPHSLHFSPNGEYIIEEASGSIFIYTSSNGEFVKAFIYPEDHACNLSFGNNGNTLVITCNNGIHFIDLIKMKEIVLKYINSDDIEVRICALSNSNNILFIGNNKKRSYDIYSAPFVNNKRIHTVDTIYVKNKELFVDYDVYDGVHFGTNTKGINDYGIVYAWWKRFRNEWEYDYKFNYCNGILRIDNNTAPDFKTRLNIPYIGNIWADGLHAYINSTADLFASFNLLNLEIRDKNSDIKYNLKHDSELITASFSKDSKYVVTLTANQIVHVWDIGNSYPYEIYNLRLDSSSYEYATMSDKNGYIYLVDFPSYDSTNRIILKKISLPTLNDIIVKLKSTYGSYKLTQEDRITNFLE